MEKNIVHGKVFSFLFILFVFFASLNHTKARHNKKRNNCEVDRRSAIRRIGSVTDQSSRAGKEQKIAIQMAVNDFNRSSNCYKLDLHSKDLHGKSSRAASTAIELVKHQKVQAMVAALSLEEATLVTEFPSAANIPIITIGSATISPSPLFPQPPSVFQLNTDIGLQAQCAAAIIGHFRWRKVTVIYEQSNSLYADSKLAKQLSKLLKPFNSVIEMDLALPSLSSLEEPEAFIEDELNKLRRKRNRVFVLAQSSMEFAIVLFHRAKRMGMMEKGYVWIVYDDVASLIDSMGPSVVQTMKGVIGVRTEYEEKTKPFRDFSSKFRRNFKSAYPEEEHPYPSLYALRAYDATWAIANAVTKSRKKTNSYEIINRTSSSHFEGLSGKISFDNGKLTEKSTTFKIIRVTGKLYKEIALFSPGLGFSMNERQMEIVPKERKLKIGVPIRAASPQFVSVRYDKEERKEIFSGFSVEVFKEAVARLPYNFIYDFVPFDGTYDEMLVEVFDKRLDGAVADMTILEYRYDYVDFSQPYMDSQIVMVVTAKQNFKKQRSIFVTAFEWKLWVAMAALSVFTGSVIYLNEHANNNPEFRDPFPQIIGSILWFSVTLLSFAQRESIRNNLSRLVLAVWLFVIMVMIASYTAILSSMMTVPRLQPSIVEVDYLQRTNAIVGCNEEGFIPKYLRHSLKFKKEKIKKFDSLSEYTEAFEQGEISAAFFTSPHAKLFLASNSKRYVISTPSLQVGGFAYAFQKGSHFSADISKAILRMKQRGIINSLEKSILSFSNNSSDQHIDDLRLYLSNFSGPLIVSSAITAFVFFILVIRVVHNRWSIRGSIQA